MTRGPDALRSPSSTCSRRWRAPPRPPAVDLADAARSRRPISGGGSSRASSGATRTASTMRVQVAPAADRRAARARGDVPPVHGLPVVQGDRRTCRSTSASRACAIPSSARGCSPRSREPRRRRRQPDPAARRPAASRTLDLVAMRLFRIGERPTTSRSRRRLALGEATRGGRAGARGRSTTRCSRTTASALLYFPLYNYTGHRPRRRARDAAPTRSRSSGSATAARTSAPSATRASRRSCSRTGLAIASGAIPLERVVQMQAHDTARYIGLADRGTIAAGAARRSQRDRARRLGLPRPELHATCPLAGGGSCRAPRATSRRSSRARWSRSGPLTGARPGRLVRAGS